MDTESPLDLLFSQRWTARMAQAAIVGAVLAIPIMNRILIVLGGTRGFSDFPLKWRIAFICLPPLLGFAMFASPGPWLLRMLVGGILLTAMWQGTRQRFEASDFGCPNWEWKWRFKSREFRFPGGYTECHRLRKRLPETQYVDLAQEAVWYGDSPENWVAALDRAARLRLLKHLQGIPIRMSEGDLCGVLHDVSRSERMAWLELFPSDYPNMRLAKDLLAQRRSRVPAYAKLATSHDPGCALLWTAIVLSHDDDEAIERCLDSSSWGYNDEARIELARRRGINEWIVWLFVAACALGGAWRRPKKRAFCQLPPCKHAQTASY